MLGVGLMLDDVERWELVLLEAAAGVDEAVQELQDWLRSLGPGLVQDGDLSSVPF